jgi:O-methyltransferase involved in polyketide biosynthesis
MMAKINLLHLEQMVEPLLLPLYFRAMENRCPDPLVRDPIAQAWLDRIDYDFSTFESLAAGRTGALLRTRQIDRCTQAFLQARPAGVVVEISCGLETRFCRADNGIQDWFDLDLPEVIALRKLLLTGSCFAEKPRYHLIACSPLDPRWIDLLSDKIGRPFLFLAESYLACLDEADARRFVAGLQARFPGAELVLDAFACGTQQLARGWNLEGWAEGIHLLDEWSLDQSGQVLRFRLGEPASFDINEAEQEERSP